MIIDFCEKYDMLPRGSRVLLALSGGKDSVFLLEKLLELREERELTLACAHFDHKLRGAESDRDREFVKDLCAIRGLPFHLGSGAVAAFAGDQGLGTEEAARRLRYEFLEKTADSIGADRIATAHTADDNAETLILNLLRGSGLKGLCGIPPVRGRIVRPLLETTTAEILEYLSSLSIKYVEDSTNAGDEYARNRVRHHIIPALRELEPSFDQAVVRCLSLLREDEALLGAMAQDFYNEKADSDGSLPTAELAALPKPLSSRVIRLAAGGELSLTHTQAVLKLAGGQDPHAELHLPGGKVRREYDRLSFGAQPRPLLGVKRLFPGCSVSLDEAGLVASCEEAKVFDEINNSVNTFLVKSDSICGNIVIGPGKGGESIRLAGRGCTKTLKKLFAEARIPLARRGLVPVLRDDEGLVAVYGFGIAQRCQAMAGDKALKISLSPKK